MFKNLLRKTLSLRDCLGVDKVERRYFDNVAITAGAGTSVATDTIAGAEYQRIKLVHGADGVNAGDVSTANGLPVSLIAGTAAFGKLAANDGVDIGDVTINNASGASAVNIQDGGNSITVDNGGTFVVQENGAGLTSLQLIDDIVYTDDTSTHSTGASKGALLMAAATPTDSAVNANDIGAVAMTIDRKLHVSVQDALPAGSAAIGKSAANDGVDIGDVTINNASGGSAVNIQDGGNSITVDNGGTFATQPAGSVAHDGVASAVNPVLVGGFASAAAPSDVSNDTDSVRAWNLRNGARAVVLTAAGALIGGDVANGVDVDVTRLPALVAGSAAIGKLAANDGVDIGDVTINNATGASAVNIQDGGNSITVDGSITADTELPAAALLADNTTNPTVPGVAAFLMALDASGTWDRVRIDTPNSDAIDPTLASNEGMKTISYNTYYDNINWHRARGHQGRAGSIKAGDVISVSGNVYLAPQRQPVNISASGSNVLVSGQANRRIRVLNGLFMAVGAVTIQLKSNNNTDVTGPLFPGASGGFQIPEAEIGNFETQVGESLTINMGLATRLGGWLTYVLL
jgi:hypothetical protein